MSLQLGQEEVDAIRAALLVGLSCWGEVERVRDVHGVQAAMGKELPKEAKPRHPTGDAAVAGRFATALTMLEMGGAE